MKTKAEWKQSFREKENSSIAAANLILFDLFGYNLKSPSRSDDATSIRNALQAYVENENELKDEWLKTQSKET